MAIRLTWFSLCLCVSVVGLLFSAQAQAAPPERLITLLPSLTETVCALGACDKLVGVDRYSNFPAQVNKLPKLGGLDDTQVETIVALRPDLVILGPASRVQERLAALGLKVLVLESRNQADVKASLLQLGQILQHPAPMQVWQKIEAGLHQAAASVPASIKGQSVYYEVDSAPYAAGTSSFIGEILSHLGMRNIVPASLGPFPKLNPEFVLRANPHIIMLAQRSAVNLGTRPGWSSISAIQNQRICAWSPQQAEMMGRPGPRMGETAQLIATCLKGATRP